jgi:plasmid stabilization system protein ParE
MRIKLSKNATLFLRNEHRYLSQFNPRAADNVLRQLRAALRMLAEYPQAGSAEGPLDGRRRFVSGDYVIDYRFASRLLEVSHIRHGRQLPPLEKDPDLDL